MKSPLPFEQRVDTARKLGEEAGERAEFRANVVDPDFSERAMAYIRQRMQAAANDDRMRGEDLVNEMKVAGIRPPDDRAFGPVFLRAIRAEVLEPVGFVPRVKGHGTAGGRVYAKGRAV